MQYKSPIMNEYFSDCFSTQHKMVTINCNVCIVAKRCVLPKNYRKKQIKQKWPMRNRMVTWRVTDDVVTLNGQGRHSNTLRVQYLETAGDAIYSI